MAHPNRFDRWWFLNDRDADLLTYWHLDPQHLARKLASGAEGLSSQEAIRRLAQVGLNSLQIRHRATAAGLFLNQFKSPIILILLLATALSAALGDWPDAAIILTIIFGSALLSFFQEYGASNAVEKLKAKVSLKANAMRDGQPSTILAERVVPGDVILLSAGSLIPADGVLLEARDFFVNQSALTGETYPAEKHTNPSAAEAALADRSNVVFMGTSVRSGAGRALIVQTGTATAYGQIAGRLALRPPETEFERGIRRLGYLLSQIMFLLVFAIFAANVFFHKPVLDSLLFSIALAVGLTPQLLPAIININLSRGAQAMAAGGVIVRRLASIENFGSMDVLCTDKTGTLTAGVVRLDGVLDIHGQPSDDVERLAYLNANLQTGLPNALDEAIVAHGKESGLDIAGANKIDEVPYDFLRKRLSVVVEEGLARRLIIKGALDNVLDVCGQIRDGSSALPLDTASRAEIDRRFAEWSAQGFRVLGVAARDVPPQAAYTRDDEHDLTFAGFLLFFDPPKPGVKETVADLEALGVRLKIITGDNRLVARHTAETIGLEIAGLVTGSELQNTHEEALLHIADRANIFAEVDPNQKEGLIRALQKGGHVVGYMGDGINDAAALHVADVGISVDQAVDVAKEAADFVLLERDLGVLHRGILQGRRTFANTLKYVFMATSANFGNMFSVAGASLFLPFLPLLPKQILLINFLTDLPEMTIAGDNVDPELIEKPRRWDLAFIRRFMLTFGPLSSVFDYATFGALLLLLNADPERFRSGWFVESILSATVVVFAIRTRQSFRHSRPSRTMILVTIAVAVVTLLIPISPLAGPMGLVLPTPSALAAIGVIVVAYFFAAEAVKHLFYRREV